MSSPITLWCARLAWLVLPVTAGGAFADAVHGWPVGPARLATLMVWLAWASGLLALLAPRPWGTTLLRVVAPLLAVATVLTVSSTSAGSATLAIGTTVLAAALALSEPTTAAAGNALAYGDEVRYPIRIPTPLLLGPVPIAVALTGLGAVVGPLLLADADFVAGVPLTVVGLPLAWLLVRSLHSLSRRWLVLVPAGVTIVDSLTLVDPVLLSRDFIAAMRRVPATPLAGSVLDLRLGTFGGGIEIELEEPAQFARRQGRARGALVDAEMIATSVARPRALLASAGARRITIL
jgi:hypothetical protein